MESISKSKTDIFAATQRAREDALLPGPSLPGTCRGYTIPSFLAFCHRLELPYLPSGWEERRGPVGEAGQAAIDQSLINSKTSFAFRRFKFSPDRDFFRPIIQEVAVLRHPAVRNHPNIVPVQGFYLEVNGDESSHPLRPALVFPKSELGDLRAFFKKNEDSPLSILGRLKLGADIGVAIRDMHANGIVHGDISTGNVLVFQATRESNDGVDFVAKVTDFGFSTRFRGESDLILLQAGTRPWRAPESKSDRFKLSQIVKMDVYSYGLLCLWLLFYATSQQSSSRPDLDVQDPNAYISFDDDCNLLEKWKADGDKIPKWAQILLERESSLSSDIKARLSNFFKLTLDSDPEKRETMSNLVPLLDVDQVTDRPCVVSFTEWEKETEHLEIASLVTDLYNADFRVRISLATQLEKILALKSSDQKRISPSNAALQLALWYELGFKDEVQVPGTPLPSIDRTLLGTEIRKVRESQEILMKQATLVEQVSDDLQGKFFIETYRKQPTLSQKAEEHLKQEIEKASKVLDTDSGMGKHWIVLQLMSDLADVFVDRGNIQSALQYREQVAAVRTELSGKGDPFTLSSVARCASSYSALGHYEEAAALQQEVINIGLQVFPDCFTVISVQSELAQTLQKQGEFARAEQLQVDVVRRAAERLGPQHRTKIAMKGNLASIYFDQTKFCEAEKLEREVLKDRDDLHGPHHVQTLCGLDNLGTILSSQHRHLDAADVQEDSERRRNLMYSEGEVENRIVPLLNSGHNDQRQMQLNTALHRIKEALNLSKVTYPETHPTRLIAKSNLATVYQELAHQIRASSDQNQDDIAKSYLEMADVLLAEVSTAQSATRDVTTQDQHRNIIIQAQNCVDRGHPDQAIQLLTPILGPLDAVPHMKHYALNTFGLAKLGQGQLDEAEAIQRRLIDQAQRMDILGPNNRITLTYLQNLAVTVKKQSGRLKEAIHLAEECYRRRLSALGENDPQTIEVQLGFEFWEENWAFDTYSRPGL